MKVKIKATKLEFIGMAQHCTNNINQLQQLLNSKNLVNDIIITTKIKLNNLLQVKVKLQSTINKFQLINKPTKQLTLTLNDYQAHLAISNYSVHNSPIYINQVIVNIYKQLSNG